MATKETKTKPVPVASTGALASKAMLAKLVIHSYGNRVTENGVADEIAEEKKMTTASALTVRKRIIPRSELTLAVKSAGISLRQIHHTLTVPFTEDGWDLLPSALYFEYKKQVGEYIEKRKAAAEKLATALPKIKEDAKVALGELWNDIEWPDAATLPWKYRVEILYRPIPQGAHLLVDVAEDELKRVQAQVEAQTWEAVQAGVREVVARLVEVVGHMVEKLKAYHITEEGKTEGAFRDSLVTNIKDILEIAPALNLTGDKKVASFIAAVEKELTAHTANELRDSDAVREAVAAKAEDILAKMNAFLK